MQQILGLLPLAIALTIAVIGGYMLTTSNRGTAPYFSGIVFLLLGLERLILPHLFRMLTPSEDQGVAM